MSKLAEVGLGAGRKRKRRGEEGGESAASGSGSGSGSGSASGSGSTSKEDVRQGNENRRRSERGDGKRPRGMRSGINSGSDVVPAPQPAQPAYTFDDESFGGFGDGFGFNGFGQPVAIHSGADTGGAGAGLPLREESAYQEESIRVTYEDPEQRDEKRKLMSLFQSQVPGQGEEVEFVAVAASRKKKGPGIAKEKEKAKVVASSLSSGDATNTRRRSTRKSGGGRS